MKKLAILFLFVCIAGTTWAQNKETRNVDTFTKISFQVPGKLYVKQGAIQKVEIEGNSEILQKIETEVSGGRLSIERESEWRNFNWKSEDRITVYITVKDIEALSVSGSGILMGEGEFKTNNIALKVSGSGSLKIEVAASGDIDADVSGSGNIELAGSGQNFESHVSGSGRVDVSGTLTGKVTTSVSGSGKVVASGTAYSIKAVISGSGGVMASNLQVEKCDVRISGSGDVEINVQKELQATISGSGSVRYKGNPGQVNSHSSGSGKVRKM